MTSRRTLACTLTAGLFASSAAAQMPVPNESAAFSLKPRSHLAIPQTAFRPTGTSRARIDRLDLAPVDDRPDRLEIMLRRQRQTFNQGLGNQGLGNQGMAVGTAAPDSAPRSRMVLLSVQNRLAMSDNLSVLLGFQGLKLNNRSVNITGIGRDNQLRVRDWFLPRTTIAFTPRPDLALTFSYREGLRGFGDTGHFGPLGLPHEEFRAWAGHLRPERHSRLRFDADWQASPDLNLAMTGYQGRISNRLSFLDRTILPLNGGSAELYGVSIGFRHRLSPHWHWAMRFGEARLDDNADHRRSEHSLSLEAGWTNGPLKATLRGTRSSLPAFASDAQAYNRRFRIEAAMRYQSPAAPLAITLRMIDPDRLASTALMSDAPSGAALATEQARGVMLGAGLNW